MNLEKYVLDVFTHLHSIPEKALEEYKTSAYIASELKDLGYDVTEKVGGGTGVIGVLDSGQAGPVLALRSDMDSLEFVVSGETVNIHACGHDANCSMLLAASKAIAEMGIKKGKLKVVFQPAEEIAKGALQMIESGLLDDIDEMSGIHLRPIQEIPFGAATPALRHGSSGKAVAKIKGLTAHGARPHLGINAIDAAAQVVNNVNAIRLDPTVPHSAKVTKLNGGTDTTNSIPDEALIVVDCRAQTNEVMDILLKKIESAFKAGAASVGAEVEILQLSAGPGAEYDDEMILRTRDAIGEVLGKVVEEIVTPGGDDFHYYTKKLKCKTSFIGLGADLVPGLHAPDMKFNLDALPQGMKILIKIVENRLM